MFAGCNPLELKLKSGLQVTTGEVTSSLFLDDQYLEKTPFSNKQIQPGEYVLRIQPDDDNYVSYELPVSLNKGMVTVVTWNPGASLNNSGGVIYEMEKLKGTNDIQVDFQSVPDGAILSFDEGAKQFSPLLLTDLSEGNHQFEVSLPSYETQQHSIKLIKGHKVTVTVILAKTGEVPAIELDNSVPTPTPTETGTGPQVQILSTNYFVNNQEVLRVRDKASSAGGELGFAVVGEKYPLVSEQGDWLEIEFEGQSGWVSAQYSQQLNSSPNNWYI